MLLRAWAPGTASSSLGEGVLAWTGTSRHAGPLLVLQGNLQGSLRSYRGCRQGIPAQAGGLRGASLPQAQVFIGWISPGVPLEFKGHGFRVRKDATE